MLRPQFLSRRHRPTPSVASRLAEIQTAAETGALSDDELRRAVYQLVGLPPGFGETPARPAPVRPHQRPERAARHARAS